ncbi:DUF1501 domain-containing protein [Synechocystis sp. PCC 7509]|uniref:DUF1501 domain-containing protein n=1 Tax=Synechocystis sp. PCC 7509 TaxID=927677 RepID=UPI0002AC47FC|nr:DUF1501 domain-containing protein [Synechocystis sp. PCC 7509]
MKRRDFIVRSSIFSASSLIAVGTHTLIARTATAKANPKRLVVIFLRGAIDGLSAVVPYSESAYYEMRSRIAIPQPGKAKGAINLDGNFGLHPALATLMPFWEQKNLAFVHACGLPDASRSHFDAQEYMESGTPGVKNTTDGWMNRLLGSLSATSPIQAISLSPTTPRILTGKMPVANIFIGRNRIKRTPLDTPRIRTAFDKFYDGSDNLSQTYRDGQEINQTVTKLLDEEMQRANNGAPLPNGFPLNAQKLAQLMRKDPRVELGFIALGGWDTHVNQGGSKGRLAINLELLGKGLETLVKELGSAYQDTTIVVISEFGRTVRENGNGGTDHGHGNVMAILGGKVKGGNIYGDFPGLASNKLYQGRDLEVTTDFRDVIATILTGHLNLSDRELNRVLPNYAAKNNIKLFG